MKEQPCATPHIKKTGLSHLVAAGGYSYAGLRRLLQETAMRHELVALLLSLATFVMIGTPPALILGLVGLFLLLFATEALNTAIEETIDHISLQTSDRARNAKDLGSFAVFCMLLTVATYVTGVIFYVFFVR